jgi:two-component sensor histidine kinase
MALIHEKLHQSQDLSRVDLAGYVRDLAAYLFRVYGASTRAISLNVQGKGVFLDIDTAVSCGLLLNELISNALKHAFPGDRSGEISISLEMDGDHQVVLKVSDDGVGLPADLDPQTSESLGLQLVNALVEQLEGTLEIDRHRGAGFNVVFADPQNRS